MGDRGYTPHPDAEEPITSSQELSERFATWFAVAPPEETGAAIRELIERRRRQADEDEEGGPDA